MPSSPPAASVAHDPVSRGEGWVIAVVATLVMAVSYVDRQSFAALSPTICSALRISQTEYGWLTAAFSIAYLAGAPVAGWVIDRTGARRGLIGSVLVWSLVAALHALAPTFAVLFGLRIALGAAESPSFPAAAQAVQRSLPPRHRPAGFGLLFTGSSLGAMVAAPLAIGFNRVLGWRVAFVGTALVGLAWIPLWIGVTRSQKARAILANSGSAAPEGPRVDEGGTLAVGYRQPAGASPVAAPVHGLIELARLLTLPVVQRAVLLVIATAPTINFVYNWLPKYLVAERGLSQNALAGYLWLPPVFFDVGAVLFGILASARQHRSPTSSVRVRGDLVAVAGVCCATIAAIPLVHGAVLAVALASLALLGGGACFALLTSDMLSRVEPRYVSRAGGLTAAAQSLAYIVANVLIGVVLDRTGSYEGVLVGLGVVVVPGTLAWILWPGQGRRGA
jgi:predicted MFS family arabinose efflux permease